MRCSFATPLQSPTSEPRVHRSFFLADVLPEECHVTKCLVLKPVPSTLWHHGTSVAPAKLVPLHHDIGNAGLDLPTDHAPSESQLECEVFSLMRSPSTPSSARVSDGDGFSWVSDEPVDDMLVRALSVAKDAVFLKDMGSQIRISLAANKEVVSWQARLVLAT